MSYEKSAPYYDAIYTAMKDYRAEAERVRELIEANAAIPVQRLLDVACGTGLHLQYFANYYGVAGIDLDASQLSEARRRLPDVELIQADMRYYSLGKPPYNQHHPLIGHYDAITCLFSAIGHLPTVDDLNLAIGNFARHLLPGGVMIIEPWLLPHMWREGYFSMNAVDLPDVKICRMNHSSRNGNVITLDFNFLVAHADHVKHFSEQHEVMMFSETEFHIAFALAGLESIYDPAGISTNGRGVFIATKPLL